VSRSWPRSLFARTALLITCALVFFSFIAWAALVWTTLIPAAEVTAHVLAQRATLAAASYKAGMPLPDGVQVVRDEASFPQARRRAEFSLSLYLNHLRKQLQADIPGSRVLVARTVMPTELWVRTAQVPDRWFVLTWQVARPETPFAMGGLVLAGGLLSLVAAAVFARRLTAPLAALVEATRRVGEGEVVAVDASSGPSEVRSLAVAFQAMSQRLAELDERRELMLAGLSHDLRSPLARMRVAVDLLESSDADLTGQITTDVEEIDRIVGQFLHYVRAGYRETPERAIADEIVRDALGHYLRTGELNLELNATGSRLLPVESVRRVVINLVQNAFEHGQAPVTVRTLQRPGELQVSVEDRGQGISVQEWQEAIRPFHRLRAAPGIGHSGLGLATVDRLVRAAHGSFMGRQIQGGFVVDATFAVTE
jgi:two-component system osmolarity sensor histidine kinase EnvZ